MFSRVVARPILAYIYNRSGVIGKAISMPAKFAMGMALTSVSFVLIPLAAQFASAEGLVAPGWIVGTYLAQALGELLISGLGLAMVAQLVPERMHGFIMGAWFLTTHKLNRLMNPVEKSQEKLAIARFF